MAENSQNFKSSYKAIFIILAVIFIGVASTIFYSNRNSDDPKTGEVIDVEKIEEVEEKFIDYAELSNELELPINGTSGYAAKEISLHSEADINSSVVHTLSGGQGFEITEENGDWFNVKFDDFKGWLQSAFVMVNLVDVIPSIVYISTNATSSVIKSSGKNIPNVTGQALYESNFYNERFDADLEVVPVMYSTSKKVFQAQRAALKDGNTLIMYETYRPHETQKLIVDNFRTLINSDAQVKAGVNQGPWTIKWFISTGISNHQRGYAMDVSLGKVVSQSTRVTGKYSYSQTDEWVEFTMPTPMHELSVSAVVFKTPVSGDSDVAWRKVEFADSMNAEAKLLQKYATDAGFTPLASEWWHFNDLAYINRPINELSTGNFFIMGNYSSVPKEL